MRGLVEVLIVLATGLFFASVLLYGFTPWYRSLMGRLLFIVLANFTIVLILVASAYIIGTDHPLRDLFRILIYGLTFINSVIIFSSIVTLQVQGSRRV